MATTGSSSLRAIRAARLQRRQELIAAALETPGGLSDHDSVVIVDLDEIDARAHGLWRSFPYSTLHALRRGACATPDLLPGLEAGRLGQRIDGIAELEAALAEQPAERIVAGGAGRTEAELRALAAAGVTLNIDSLQELRWLEAAPQSGAAAHALTVSFAWSGPEPLRPTLLDGVDAAADRAAIVGALKRRGPLRGLALAAHPAWGADAICRAVGALVELADEIDAAGGKVAVLDLGDLIPAGDPDEEPAPVQALIDRLAVSCPDLMLGVLKGRWTLRTGVGAGVFARATALVTRVGSTRRVGGRNRAWCRAAHAGDAADVAVHTPTGLMKRGAHAHWDLHGAGCEAGPLAVARYLPPIAPGDLLWMRGLSLPCPAGRGPVFGARAVAGGLQLQPLRRAGA